MKKSVLISLSVFFVFAVSLTFFLSDEIFKITGKQIFSDYDFEQPASSFRPTNPTNSILLSPGNDCNITSISLSHTNIAVRGIISIYVNGVDCEGKNIGLNIFEDDLIFDDFLGNLSGTFMGNTATIDLTIGEDFFSLFNEIFEGEELEVYFTFNNLASSLVYVYLEIPLLQPAGPTFLGQGCTTSTYIDKDCDGYVIGGKDGHAGSFTQLAFPSPPTDEADANDNDPTLNTPASVIARYGSFTDINNFKDYLYDLGYTHQINNVFFVSLTGSDTTGQVNNINLPYATVPRPAFLAGPEGHIIKPGDVVVFRGGIWNPGIINTLGSQGWTPQTGTYDIGLLGNKTHPIIFINYPGERVIVKGQSGGQVFGTARNTSYLAIDGIEFDGTDSNGNIVANEIFRLLGPGNHITFKNVELRNSNRWGIFGPIDKDRDYYTLDEVSIHHINTEHCVYRNDIATTGTTPEELDTDRGWVIKNSIFYNCRFNGIHWRGGENFTFENNIIHTTGLNGIDIKNSPVNGTIKNNLVFNNGHGPLLIFEDNDPQRYGANGTDNILITQNIFAGRSGDNGAGGDPAGFAAIRFTHFTNPIRVHKNIQIYNNILYSNGVTPIRFEHGPDINEATIENNVFYRNGASLPNDASGMSVCGWTDGTHDSVATLACYGTIDLYIWNFDSMQDSQLRPKINNNILADPLFANVTNLYTTQFTPYFYDFAPTENSPNIDFSNPLYSTAFDLKGNARVGQADSGVYEYGVGAPAPILFNVFPSSVMANTLVTLNFNGVNFVSGAFLQECFSGSNCVDMSIESFFLQGSNLIQHDFNRGLGTYEFRVRNPDNSVSNIISVIVAQSVPNAPSGLVAQTLPMPQGATQIRLNWIDNSVDESSFEIQSRWQANGMVWTTIANPVPESIDYLHTGLTPGTDYHYRIRAINSGGASAWEPASFALGTTNDSFPLAPTDLVATPLSSTSISLTWTDIADNEHFYWIARRQSVTEEFVLIPGTETLPPNTQQYTDTGLISGTAYQYFVALYNSVGTNGSNIASATTGSCTDGQTMACPNQNGVCAGAQQTCTGGVWPGCSSSNYESNNATYNVNEIGLCSDGLDNDCDASGEFDYAGSGSIKGDNDCPVGVTGINAPSSVGTSSPFTLTCTSTAANVRSIQGLVNGNLCTFTSWNSNNALFNCVSSTPGTQTVSCNVNAAFSYQTGGDLNQPIEVGGTCSGYGSNFACEGDSACDWIAACLGTLSSGGPDRCVDAGTGSSAFICRITPSPQCSAVCDGTVNGCSQSQSCSLTTCGCSEQSPTINGVLPTSSAWIFGNAVTINGQYFANDSQVFVNGNLIDNSRLTSGASTIIFNRNALEFNVGQNQIYVRNPTSLLNSNILNFTLTSNPIISSLVPNNALNNILTIVNITGAEFDPLSKVMLFGVVEPSFLFTYVNSGLIQLTVVSGIMGADLDVSVLGGDGVTFSNSKNFRVNYPFDYVLSLDFSETSVDSGALISNSLKIEDLIYMIHEDIDINSQAPSGVDVNFIGTNYCQINISTTPNPSCDIYFNISTAGLSPGQYVINFTGNSSATNVSHQVNFIINVNVPILTTSGSSGGGGGGSGRSILPNPVRQCDDNLDNDGDGEIDYPNDLGCSSLNDNSELDPNEIVESNYTIGEKNPQNLNGSDEEVEIRFVFWMVLLALFAGIFIVSVLIVNLLRKNRINHLTKDTRF